MRLAHGLRGSCVLVRVCHPLRGGGPALHWCRGAARSESFTLKKLECLKQASAVNTLAWNNNLGLCSYFVGFEGRSND